MIIDYIFFPISLLSYKQAVILFSCEGPWWTHQWELRLRYIGTMDWIGSGILFLFCISNQGPLTNQFFISTLKICLSYGPCKRNEG